MKKEEGEEEYNNYMRCYFTASIAGKKQYLTHYRAIVSELEKQGSEVLADHVLNQTESQIRLETREERLAFHKQLEKWITECDCVVVEGSFPSISVGYEISLALHRNKMVLLLHLIGDPPALISSCNEDRVICERYNMDSLSEIIGRFLNYVGGKTDTRFTFYLTAAQMAHLEERAQAKRVPKAVFLRDLIDKDIKS